MAPGPDSCVTAGHTLTPSAGGALIGVVAAIGLSTLIESSIYEVSRPNPLAQGASFVFLIAAAATASWLPARRASSVDPPQVLNAD